MRRDPPRLDAWQPWRPAELAARLAGCAVPWYVAGGWALDPRPEIVLRDKAKARLDPAAPRWLAGALDLHHPGHDRRGRINDVPGRYA